MTLQERNEELAYIATLTDQQVCIQFNVDHRHEIIAAIEEEYDDEEEDDDDEEYWNSYAEDMIIERKKEYSHF